ncbi:MAG TPA: hypothetical protein VGE37_16135 [Archangium sp.]
MSLIRAVVVLALSGCGTPPSLDEVTRFEDRGLCDTARERLTLPTISTSCLRAGPVRVVTDPAALDEQLDCPPPDVDFRTQRVLLVPAQQPGVEGFVLPNFVARAEDHLELGVIIRRLGAVPQSSLVLLPLEPQRVRVLTCESVCVEGCDRAIPAGG